MGLLGNGFRENLSGRISSATTNLNGANASTLAASYNLTAFRRNQLTGEAGFLSKASVPSGTRAPIAWLMPIKPGGLASHNETAFAFSVTGSGVYGRNINAQLPLNFTIDQANLALVVSGQVSIGWSMVMTPPSIAGVLYASANVSGVSFSVIPVLGAMTGMGATLPMSFTFSPNIKAKGYISAIISSEGEGVTTQSVAREVWNTVAASFNLAGTMGNKMNSAASAGDPWGTELPGGYLAGTAGQILGSIINEVNLHTDAALADIDTEVDLLAFNGAVAMSSDGGTAGTEFPLGTPAHPVNNWADARAIAQANGLSRFSLSGTWQADDGFEHVLIRGNTGFTADSFDLNNKPFNSCRIENMTVTGLLGATSDPANVFSDCYIKDVYQMHGEVQRGRMEADIFILPGKSLSCVNPIVEGDFTVIDMGSDPASVFSGDIASGSIVFKNAVAGSLIELNISGGDVTLGASCTGGEYWIEGYGMFYNESAMTEKGNQLIQTTILQAMNEAPPAVDAVKMNGSVITGTGQENDKWRAVGVPG